MRDRVLAACCSHQPSNTDLSRPLSAVLNFVSLVDYDSFSLTLPTWSLSIDYEAPFTLWDLALLSHVAPRFDLSKLPEFLT